MSENEGVKRATAPEELHVVSLSRSWLCCLEMP